MPDAIDAAIDSIPDAIDATPAEAAPEVTAEAVTDAPQSVEDSIDATLEAIYDKNNPPRDEAGKFAGKQQAQPEAVEGEDAEITDQPQTEEDGQPEAVATEPPQSWSAAQREMWAKIPPEARDYIAQRETEATKTISRMGQELSRFRPLNELLTQHQDTFARHGADPQTGIARLLDVQTSLDSDPGGTIAAIAELYGVDLTAYAAQPQGEQDGQPQYQPDPVLLQTRQELAQLRQHLSEREQREDQSRKNQEYQLQRQTDEEVSKWSATKEHFGDPAVKQMMAAAIANGTADTLDDAYDMAVHAIPTIRQKVTESERKTAEAKRTAEKAKHASEAKRSATVNAGTARRAASVPSGKWDSEGYLESVFERAAGG